MVPQAQWADFELVILAGHDTDLEPACPRAALRCKSRRWRRNCAPLRTPRPPSGSDDPDGSVRGSQTDYRRPHLRPSCAVVARHIRNFHEALQAVANFLEAAAHATAYGQEARNQAAEVADLP